MKCKHRPTWPVSLFSGADRFVLCKGSARRSPRIGSTPISSRHFSPEPTTLGHQRLQDMLLSPSLAIGQGARRRCPVCNFPISIKPTGRTRTYCSDRCRDASRRDRDFCDSSVTPYSGLALPRNPEKSSTNSAIYGGGLADRAPTIRAPIVTIGLGVHAGPQPREKSTERAALIRNAIRAEVAARWSTGLR